MNFGKKLNGLSVLGRRRQRVQKCFCVRSMKEMRHFLVRSFENLSLNTICCFIFPLTFIWQTLLSSGGLLKYAFHHFFFWSENKWKMMLEIVGSIKGSTTLICQFKSSFLKPTFWIFDHLYFMLNKLSTIYKGF